MKKISCLLLMLLLLFTVKLPVHAADSMVIRDLNVKIKGLSFTVVDLSFVIEQEVTIDQIIFNCDLSGGSQEIAYDRARDNDLVEIEENGTPVKNANDEVIGYKYHFIIDSQSGKIGTFEIKINYTNLVDWKSYQYSIYVTNGNSNVESEVFSTKNALIIGLLATMASAIATFIIVKASERNVQIRDEEE